MNENRQVTREPIDGVSTMAHLTNGEVREGVVHNVSDGGIKISGETGGIHPGDRIDIVLVIRNERVRYAGEVRHVDASGHFYGVHFLSGPNPVPDAGTDKCCTRCKRNFPEECHFCNNCGQKLVMR